MLFGAVLRVYEDLNPNGELIRFKQMVARILGCTVEEAIPQLNQLMENILPLRPLHDCGFTEKDIVEFPKSVEINQQRLITNSYVPMTQELMQRIYRECF